MNENIVDPEIGSVSEFTYTRPLVPLMSIRGSRDESVARRGFYNALMNKFLLLFLAGVVILASVSIYFVDREFFIVPIEYRDGIIIRNDSRGDGYFQARRNGTRLHNGVDLQAQIGTPVRAVRFGRVTQADFKKNGLGNYVIISHPGGLDTVYAHLSEILVSQGTLVRQGDIVGKVGKTGNASHPQMQAHLHFEIRQGNIPIDPMPYLDG